MSKIKYNADLLKIMFLFEKITRTRLKDCFIDNNQLLTFVVPSFQIGKAVGKNAVNVKKLENLLKRKIKIVAFNPSAVLFIKNLIYPITAEVEKQNNVIIIKASDMKSRAFLIGRNQVNLKNNLKITKKYFKEIENIKVV